jgi:hypothetical protein
MTKKERKGDIITLNIIGFAVMIYLIFSLVLCHGQSVKAAEISPTIEDGIYEIAPRANTEYRLTILGNTNLNGADFCIWRQNSSNNYMKFQITYIGEGYYKVIDIGSGKAMDVFGGLSLSGTNVQQYKYNQSNAQLWKIDAVDDGYYEFTPKCAKSRRLNLVGNIVFNGANIEIHTKNSSKAQQWKLIPSSKADDDPAITSESTKVSISNFISKKIKTAYVTWKKITGIDGYQIQLAQDKNFTVGVKTYTTTELTKNVTGLVKGKTYYVRVRAYKDVDGVRQYGAWSDVWNTKVKSVDVADITLKTVTSPSKKKIKIQFKTEKNVSKYIVQVSLTKNFKSQTLERTSTSKDKGKLSLAFLRSKKTYYVRVRAVRKVKGKTYTGAWSKVKKVKVK